jgi:negative regulator of sigma E activity
MVKYRVPLKLDVSAQRNQRETLSAVYDNPLMASQNLARNAEHDEEMYSSLLQDL